MLDISPIPAFDDNYIWLLRDSGSTQTTVVDPGDEGPVLAALEAQGLELSAILVTHHHDDHIGGVEDLRAAFPKVRVLGPEDRRICALTHVVREGDTIEIPDLSERFQVLEVPGHTSTHIAYLGAGALFCGDTLFAAGCGRVFDGTFDQLAASLERIAALPEATRCYCAHEYTLANLGFAGRVEPESTAIAQRKQAVSDLRALGRPTVPSRLREELATNPFLRTGIPTVRSAAEAASGKSLTTGAEVFTALRRWKDGQYD
ncbi:hydroxyacylglutathione hydrolase [Candidatus Thiosymbion oneisti]|uniref:hydroxyacylglutathione hydrolase n=1 Tax=Candidatus Thiosymbion oneisti TaxID=589554 RepID=UPI000B1AD354|nr:hydroxyacylglutathione hydrolase [Candidatus Thiosymbion oneisti]